MIHKTKRVSSVIFALLSVFFKHYLKAIICQLSVRGTHLIMENNWSALHQYYFLFKRKTAEIDSKYSRKSQLGRGEMEPGGSF